jgi:hypothetical protein
MAAAQIAKLIRAQRRPAQIEEATPLEEATGSPSRTQIDLTKLAKAKRITPTRNHALRRSNGVEA